MLAFALKIIFPAVEEVSFPQSKNFSAVKDSKDFLTKDPNNYLFKYVGLLLLNMKKLILYTILIWSTSIQTN